MTKISIEYEFFGGISIKLKSNTGKIEVPKNTTIKEFITEIAGIPERYLKYMDITINGKHIPADKKLKNNNKIKILMPVGGG